MSDLAGFLLARIAEDEDKARRTRWGAMDRPWVLVLPSKLRAVNGEFPPDHLHVSGRRVLAECEAKRQIVKRISDVKGWSGSYAVRDVVLELLALPYSDHPDFDPRWRVSGE